MYLVYMSCVANEGANKNYFGPSAFLRTILLNQMREISNCSVWSKQINVVEAYINFVLVLQELIQISSPKKSLTGVIRVHAPLTSRLYSILYIIAIEENGLDSVVIIEHGSLTGHFCWLG